MKGKALAPSQQIRSTLGCALAIVLGATLALSACGTQQPGAAAIVNGTTISDKDVQKVVVQLNALPEIQEKLTPNDVLLDLILAPYILTEADKTGKKVPEAEVHKIVDKVPNPAQATTDFVRMQLAIPGLSEASKASVLAALAKAKITVSPRYGALDLKQTAIVPTTPNWIKKVNPTPAPR